MHKIPIYSEGGARNNPGLPGAGAVIIDGSKRFELKKFLGSQTNNWAEYEAVALALQEAKKRGFAKREIEVRLDSQLVAEQLSDNYQVKEATLWPQYMKVHNLLVEHFPDAVFKYIPREQNKEADRLVNEAIDESGFPR